MAKSQNLHGSVVHALNAAREFRLVAESGDILIWCELGFLSLPG